MENPEQWSAVTFRKQYAEYCNLLGERVKLVLPLGDTTVELPLLWRLVLSLGGSEAVARLHLWPAIVEQLLDEAPGNEAVVENLKALYKERLTGFEDYLNKGKQLPVPSGRLLRGDAAGAAGLARPPPAFRPSDRAGPSNEAAPDKAATRSKAAGPSTTSAGAVPEVPDWAMKPGVFFPVPKPSRRDPRLAGSPRDPRLQTGKSVPQDSAPKPAWQGGQPQQQGRYLWVTQQPRATSGQHADPLASFSGNPMLKAKISAALAQRTASLSAGKEERPGASKPALDFVPVKRDAPVKKEPPGRWQQKGGSGFMPLTALPPIANTGQARQIQGKAAADLAGRGQKRARGGGQRTAATAEENWARPPKKVSLHELNSQGQGKERRRSPPGRTNAPAPGKEGRHGAARLSKPKPAMMDPVLLARLQGVDATDAVRRLRGLGLTLATVTRDGQAQQSTDAEQKQQLSDGAAKVLEPSQLEWLECFRRAHWKEAQGQQALLSTPRSQLGVRRSSRTRSRPAAFVPGSSDETPARRDGSEDENDPEPSIREGDLYQAELPAVRPKPREPTAEEAQWLEHQVLERGSYGNPAIAVPLISGSNARGDRWYESGRQRLPGWQVEALGLDRMGMADAEGWTDGEIAIFERGLNADGRDFAGIASRLLPAKGPARVASFYYNVWKTRGVPRARAWYRRRQEERDRVENERLAAEASRQQMHAAQLARRQLKEGLAWLKALARQPLLPQNTKVRADRMGRAIQALARANMRKR